MKALYAPVAQLDRVTDYESVGRGFESLPAYQKSTSHQGCGFFAIHRKGLEPFNAAVRWTAAKRRLDGVWSLM